MKKHLTVILVFMLVIVCVGCTNNKPTEHLIDPVEFRIEDTYSAVKNEDKSKKVSGYVAEIGKGVLSRAIPISDEDTNTIAEILNEPGWMNKRPKCLYDCVLTIYGTEVYYHSDCGMFETIDKSVFTEYDSENSEETKSLKNDEAIHLPNQEIKMVSLDITDDTRDVVNDILGKYIDVKGVQRKVGFDYKN